MRHILDAVGSTRRILRVDVYVLYIDSTLEGSIGTGKGRAATAELVKECQGLGRLCVSRERVDERDTVVWGEERKNRTDCLVWYK